MRWAVEGVGEKGVRVHTVVGVERAGDEGTLGVVIIWVLERKESRKRVKGLVRVANEGIER